jgi:hypothetical protein
LVQAQPELLLFLFDYQEIWHAQFPELHRRGQWHFTCHLCTRGSGGTALAELSSIVKPLFLLDDATVRERIQEMQALGLCEIDPPDRTLSARSIVIPTEELLRRYDAHLRATAGRLREAARTIDPAIRPRPDVPLNPTTRQMVLRAIEQCDEAWLAALEAMFDQLKLTPARRLDARRHLLSLSHRMLLLMSLRHAFAPNAQTPGTPPDGGEGLLADDMAALLLRLARQNFQTTRDHIGQLMQLGVLQRRSGRALRVALAPDLMATFTPILARLAVLLPAMARELDGMEDVEQTLTVSRSRRGALPAVTRRLIVAHADEPSREVPIGIEPLVLGRSASSDIVLTADLVSRVHCRLVPGEAGLMVVDLQSTNGTYLDGKRLTEPAAMRTDSELRVGPYTLTLRDDALPIDPESTAKGGRRRQPA